MFDDLEQFKSIYITECFELLEGMEEQLLSMEEGDDDAEALNAVFRCAHTVKGGGGAFGFTELVNFTHVAEFLLDGMREAKIPVTQAIIDLLLRSVDVIRQLVEAVRDGVTVEESVWKETMEALQAACDGVEGVPSADSAAEGGDELEQDEVGKEKKFSIHFHPHASLFERGNEPLLIIRELKSLGEYDVQVEIQDIPFLTDIDCNHCYFSWEITLVTQDEIEAVQEAFEFVEGDCDLTITCQEMDDLDEEDDLALEDEFGGVFPEYYTVIDDEDSSDLDSQVVQKGGDGSRSGTGATSIAQPSAAKSKPATASAPQAVTSSIRVDIDKVDALVNMVGELVITQAMLAQQSTELSPEQHMGLLQGLEELSRHTRDLQESVMAVRMQPVKSVFTRMSRVIRDLSRKLDKNISVETNGEETELDKTVIEQLGDPLMHMVRNSVDHGVENSEERVANGKTPHGTVSLTARSTGGRILIEIEDDGRGIDRDRVRSKAIEKGVIQSGDNLSDSEIDMLIFAAGFSTAEEVTDVSGRGVGMDVVRRNIESLGGVINIANVPGEGAKFTISLPLTLAILDGMIVRCGEEKYIIPLTHIIETIQIKPDMLSHVADGADVINVRGEFIPIIYLADIFDVPNPDKNVGNRLVMLVESGNSKLGVCVDELLRREQVVLKSIEDNANAVSGISGATILGDGNVSLIVDVAQLYQMLKVSVPNRQAA